MISDVHNVDFLTRGPTNWLLQSYAPAHDFKTDHAIIVIKEWLEPFTDAEPR